MVSRIGLSLRGIAGNELGADIKDGEVIGWKPITMEMLNSDITACIKYLQAIKKAMQSSKDKV